MTEETRTYSGEKTIASLSGSGKPGQLYVRSEIRTFSNTKHKDSNWIKDLNIGWILNFRGKHRQNTIINYSNVFLAYLLEL